ELESSDEERPKLHAASGSATAGPIFRGVMAKGKHAHGGTSYGSSSSSESSSYVLSSSNLADVAEALGASGARLIGGQVVGSLRFESREHEWGFLSKAGDS